MTTPITIYHNPRCSKSRQTLALLEKSGISPEVILYLQTPPSSATIKKVLKSLEISARDLMRTKEVEYKEQNLADTNLSEQKLINAIISTPKLMERPIVVKGSEAVIGRPPENVLALL